MAELKALSTAALMLAMLASPALSIPAMGPAYGLGPSDYAPPGPQELLEDVQQQGMLFDDPEVPPARSQEFLERAQQQGMLFDDPETSWEASVQDKTCYDTLYVMAFTSGVKYGDSDDSPYVEIKLKGVQARHVKLYDRAGDDYASNKGDLWKIKVSSFGLKCFQKSKVEKLALVEDGNDGWHIDSIVTFLNKGTTFTLLTSNFNAFRWLDGNEGVPLRRFELTIV